MTDAVRRTAAPVGTRSTREGRRPRRDRWCWRHPEVRTFRVGADGGLYPVNSSTAWTEGWNTATCARGRDHAPPDPDCRCGFYVYAHPIGLRSGKRSLRVGMRIGGSSGDVGTHWCGLLSPLRCMARGLRVPLDCCRRARGFVSWQKTFRATPPAERPVSSHRRGRSGWKSCSSGSSGWMSARHQ